jgi:hypothetical protein
MESILNQNEKHNIDEIIEFVRTMPESEQKIMRAFSQGIEFAQKATENTDQRSA